MEIISGCVTIIGNVLGVQSLRVQGNPLWGSCRLVGWSPG